MSYSYKQAGVDLEAGYEAVSRIKSTLHEQSAKVLWAQWVDLEECLIYLP